MDRNIVSVFHIIFSLQNYTILRINGPTIDNIRYVLMFIKYVYCAFKLNISQNIKQRRIEKLPISIHPCYYVFGFLINMFCIG